MAASSSAVANSNNSHYDVFINHRGTDVKKTFASHLYRRLLSYGLRIFLDQPELERGDYFPSQIENAIRSASVHIAIFSPGYAESSWCLNELVQMLDSEATIIPVFYHVNPSELRWTRAKKRKYAEALEEPACDPQPQPHERRRYAEALEELEKKTTLDPQTHEETLRYNSTTVEKWRNALSRVADISGFELDACNGDEGELVDTVVKRVLKKVKKPALDVAKYPTGLGDKVKDFENLVLLQQQHFTPQMLGIVGLGGIGKTTLAKEIYNRKNSEYQRTCFLFDVRSNSLNSSQSKLLNSLTGSDKPVNSVDEGIAMLREHLSSTNALVVIDDVDNVDQLDTLLPHQTALHSNSLVLITSRNKGVLRSRVEETSIYKLKELSSQHSTELFCSHAFQQPYPLSGFESLVEKYLATCNGLPLSLKVFGALLYGQDITYSEEQLESLQEILPTTEIHQRLKISYNSLNEHEKQIFLDIACFLRGENKNMAIRIWDGSGWKGRLGFQNLQDKSLIEVDSENEIHMHDHLRDMGREIAAEDSRLPRRLWRWTENTIDDLLPPSQDGQGIPVRGIRMDLSEYNGFDDEDALGGIRMKRLQLLDIEDILLDRILPKVQSPNLIWLRWKKCPYSSLPSSIPMKNLRVLHVTGDELKTLWQDEQAPLQLRELEIDAPLCNIPKSIGKLKHIERIVIHRTHHVEVNLQSLEDIFCHLQSLKTLVLRGCQMKSLPECFGNLTNLQHIDLYSCSKLERLPDSFSRLINLQYLNLAYCFNLTMSAETLGNISRLEYISLTGCTRIEVLPLQVVHQRPLEQLHLDETNLKELPSAIGDLSALEVLWVQSPLLDRLPPSLGDLRNLKYLYIYHCKELKFLPASLGQLSQLTMLRICGCLLLDTLPPSLGDLRNLKDLTIEYCQELKCLTSSLGNLRNLKSLAIIHCQGLECLPPSLGDLRNLKSLDIELCFELKCLPPSLGDLNNLKVLHIIHCMGLKCLPASLGLLSQLTVLNVVKCPLLDTLPPSLGDLRNLKTLYISNCKELTCLPASLGQMSELTKLGVDECQFLDTLPSSLGDLRNLKYLSIRNCKELKCLPASLGLLSQLTELHVEGCPLLDKLPPSLGDLENLKKLDIYNCEELKCLPASLGLLSQLTQLKVDGCPLLDTLQHRWLN